MALWSAWCGILYGEGDRFGCWLDVALGAIVWHRLKDGREADATQQDGGAPGTAVADGHKVSITINPKT